MTEPMSKPDKPGYYIWECKGERVLCLFDGSRIHGLSQGKYISFPDTVVCPCCRFAVLDPAVAAINQAVEELKGGGK